MTYYNKGPARFGTWLYYLRRYVNSGSLNFRLEPASSPSRADIVVASSRKYHCQPKKEGGYGGAATVVVGADCQGNKGAYVMAHEVGHALGLKHEPRKCAVMNAWMTGGDRWPYPWYCAPFRRRWLYKPYLADDIAGLKAYFRNHAPVAKFALASRTVEVYKQDAFTDYSEDVDWNLRRESIDWGDGSKQSFSPHRFVRVPNWAVSHAWSAPGTYTVRLSARDTYGKVSTFAIDVMVTGDAGGGPQCVDGEGNPVPGPC